MLARSHIIGILLVLSALSASAQDSPFLPVERFEALRNEISGDLAYDHLRSLVLYHAPEGTSRGFREIAGVVEKKAREAGLADVRYIELKAKGVAWTPLSAELWLMAPEQVKLGSYAEVATTVIDYSSTADITAELVDVGEGTRAPDYEGRDVKGKVVLASGSPERVRVLAVSHGAAAIVCYASHLPFRGGRPEQVPWLRFAAPKEGQPLPLPGIAVSARTASWLRALLRGEGRPIVGLSTATATPPPSGPVQVRVRVEAEHSGQATQGLVEGYIRGTGRGPAIVLTSHLQEEKTSANDDRSGVASMLEIARALHRLLAEGKIPRPARDIRFWWVNEIDAEYEYFASYPAEPAKMLANINQDMVGALQSAGSREQHVTRPPFSRASFLADVAESIVDALVLGNTSFLAAGGRNTRESHYTRPVFSRLGSHERYAARVVPHFSSSDHLVFNDAAVGVPGVTFTNWPDPFIHSSDDDLWQIDRTQLQRNALAVAAIALYLANAGDREARELAVHMAAAGRQRVFRDLTTGIELIRRAARGDPAPEDAAAAAYGDAGNLVRQAVAREERALASLAALGGPAGALSRRFGATLREEQGSYLGRLNEAYETLTGARPPAGQALTEAEKQAAARVPRRAAGLREYVDRRSAVTRVAGLHPLMQYEADNFVDGARSCLEIYRAVRAEALAAGEWYYGEVRLADVVQRVENGVAAGTMAWK